MALDPFVYFVVGAMTTFLVVLGGVAWVARDL